jgi:hypothetical protein
MKFSLEETMFIGGLLKKEIKELTDSLEQKPADPVYDRRVKWKDKYSSMLDRIEIYINEITETYKE